MKCKHCGAELVPVTFYVDASYLNSVGMMVAAPQPEWRPVEAGQTVYVPNVAAAASWVPSVFIPCRHELMPEAPNTTGANG